MVKQTDLSYDISVHGSSVSSACKLMAAIVAAMMAETVISSHHKAAHSETEGSQLQHFSTWQLSLQCLQSDGCHDSCHDG